MYRIAVLIVLAALTGCSGPMVTQEGSRFTLIDGLYDYGAGGRDLKLTVRGNPFPMPNDVFSRVVETDLQIPSFRQPTHPRLTPDSSARPGYELVLVFSPAPTLDGQDLCAGKVAHGSGEGEVRVIGAFCVSGAAKTQAIGRTEASSADDARFLGLMRQMMTSLFRQDIRTSTHAHSLTIP